MMMKFNRAILVTILLAVASTTTDAIFTPLRLPFEALQQADSESSDSSLLQALTTTGMVSITNLPGAFQDAMKTMVATQHKCIESLPIDTTQVQSYADGTVRTTLATHTVPGVGGKQPLFKSKMKVTPNDLCTTFEEATKVIRSTTQDVVQAFATKLTSMLVLNVTTSTTGSSAADIPLLVAKQSNEDIDAGASPFTFDTFMDVVENGEHLEHFHSYMKSSQLEEHKNTIELHTDHGIFLVFTPGRLSLSGELTNGFFIETSDGRTEEVHFFNYDELVIMLGDGINQLVNNKISESDQKLRAVPHSVILESSELARVWYGLMVLPPSSALHPKYNDVTFGEIRHGLLSGNQELISLACTSTMLDDFDVTTTTHRMLAGNESTSCNDDELYCWHRCMNVAEFNVSDGICSGQNKTLSCINPRYQLSTGLLHGDYYPGCAGDDWVNETEFEKLPNYPRDDAICGGFDTYYNDNMFTYSVPLNNGVGAIFQYNLTADGIVKGRLAYNGIFGFLALGFAGTGGRLAMYNASIVMAMRGGNYTAQYGLDLRYGHQIEEFVTHPNQTAFRHWNFPYVHDHGDDMVHDHGDNHVHDDESNNGTTATQRSSGRGRVLGDVGDLIEFYVDEENDGCFTALYINMKDIAGRYFNLNGSNTMIWAANSKDIFMQYHGDDRGNFTIDWTKAVVEGSDAMSGATTTVMGMSLLFTTALALFASI